MSNKASSSQVGKEKEPKKTYHNSVIGSQRGSSQDAVPILTYGPKTNYLKWRRELNVELERQFGLLGRCAADGEYYDPPEVNVDEYDSDDDEHGFHIQVLHQRIKRREDLIQKLIEDRPKAYAYVISRMSEESREAITRHEDYLNFSRFRDVLALINAVQQFHVGQTFGDEDFDREDAYRQYHMMKMGDNESLLRYKERFVAILEMMIDRGCEVPVVSSQVVHFLSTSATRFQPIVKDILRKKRQFADFRMPRSLLEAYDELVHGSLELGIKLNAFGSSEESNSRGKVAFIAEVDEVGSERTHGHSSPKKTGEKTTKQPTKPCVI